MDFFFVVLRPTTLVLTEELKMLWYRELKKRPVFGVLISFRG